MKRYIKIAAGLIIGATVTISCSKDFLKEEVYSSYAPETLKDSLGLEASVVGLQNHLSTFFSYSDPQGWPSVLHAGTDIAWVPPTQRQGIEIPYYDYTQLISTDGAASYTWSWAYRMINNTNIIINNVEDPSLTGITTAGKNSFSAEARFFRAYAYNMLATLFGKVPLVTKPLTAPKTDFTRTSLDSVNNLIISDLTFAATNLPQIDKVKKAARPNQAMAQQLLAEVYLRTGKNDLAEQQCQAIIASGKFGLITSRYGVRTSQPGDFFNDMFWFGNQRRSQGNKEAIWVMEQENPATVTGGITNNPQQRRNWGAAYYQINTPAPDNKPMVITDSLGGRGIARMRLTDWVVYGLYEPQDVRNSHYNLRRKFYYNVPGSPWNGKEIPYAGADTVLKLHRIQPNGMSSIRMMCLDLQ